MGPSVSLCLVSNFTMLAMKLGMMFFSLLHLLGVAAQIGIETGTQSLKAVSHILVSST
jgi:hypothetical protein